MHLWDRGGAWVWHQDGYTGDGQRRRHCAAARWTAGQASERLTDRGPSVRTLPERKPHQIGVWPKNTLDRRSLSRVRIVPSRQLESAIVLRSPLEAARRFPRALDPAIRLRRGIVTWRTVLRAVDSEVVQQAFRDGAKLPFGFGVGLNERVVEYPWLFSRRPTGLVLDAGSTLNHRAVLRRLLPSLSGLHIVTLGPEGHSFPKLGVSYVYSDLRELPYASETFDDVTCVSTLEHVGMDNSRYARGAPAPGNASESTERALSELLRVLRVGGRLLLTVPYGRPDDRGWLRVFGRADVDRLTTYGSRADLTVYAYGPEGWQLSDPDRAADAVYRERSLEPAPGDLAVCARAVACIEITR